MLVQPVKLSLWQRLLGRCATELPTDPECWTYEDGRVTVKANRAAELSALHGAVRLEGKGLPERVLLFRGSDGDWHAVCNRCTHGGRRLDPVPGTELVQCCSMGRSVYDYGGHVVEGPAKGPIRTYPVKAENGLLTITV